MKHTKANLHDQKIIGKPSFGVQQVSFQEGQGSPTDPGTTGGIDMEALAKVVSFAIKEAMSSSLKASPNRSYNPGSPK